MYDRIFDLIRRGEVIIFCGAGTSIAAGYPSGYQLAKTIYATLSDEEKQSIPDNLDLSDLAEQYVNLKLGKRNALNKILKDIFEKPSTGGSIHHQLAKIPQIKTIITTNYDDLFERAYGSSACVVRSSEDVAYLDGKKAEIFKIHGDFIKIDKILITRGDYTRFFDSQKEELIWTLVKERMATNNVLFIGYNLEDINVESLFRKITESLGSHAKETFLLSPNLNTLKATTLIRQGINYINTTAELFFEGLVENIKDNITYDFKDQLTDAETFRKFLKNYDLEPTLNAIEDKFTLGAVAPRNANPTGEITINIDYKNTALLERLLNLSNHSDIAPLELEPDTLLHWSMTLNGVKFPSEQGDRLIINPAAFLTETVDITFGNGHEYHDMTVDVYKTKSHIVFVLALNTLSLHIKIIRPIVISNKVNLNFNLSIKRDGEYKKASEEIATYSFLHDLGSTGQINIFHPSTGVMSYGLMLVEPLAKDAEKHLFYFRAIKTIEKYFTVKFGDIKKITQDDYIILVNAYTLATEGEIISNSKDGFTYTYNDYDAVLLFIKELKANDSPDLCSQSDSIETLELHGIKLELGYRNTRLMHPYIENEQDVINGRSKNILINSRSNSIITTFSKNKIIPENG
jgi:hypothetical protein